MDECSHLQNLADTPDNINNYVQKDIDQDNLGAKDFYRDAQETINSLPDAFVNDNDNLYSRNNNDFADFGTLDEDADDVEALPDIIEQEDDSVEDNSDFLDENVSHIRTWDIFHSMMSYILENL